MLMHQREGQRLSLCGVTAAQAGATIAVQYAPWRSDVGAMYTGCCCCVVLMQQVAWIIHQVAAVAVWMCQFPVPLMCQFLYSWCTNCTRST